jgi:hypothetical protein
MTPTLGSILATSFMSCVVPAKLISPFNLRNRFGVELFAGVVERLGSGSKLRPGDASARA